MLAATAPDPASALGALNRGLTERTPLGRFFTAFYGVLDPAKGTLKYSNAGYGYPILVRCSGATESLTGSGLVMGLFSTVSYPAMTVQLEVGDLLVLYSDGLNETVNIHDEEFGTERIANIVLASKQRSAQDILRALSESLEAWRGGLPFSDDVTMVVLRRVTS
jgi:sigma-B regulation protein RsbU (phosphoserine phosphatase)